MWSLLLGGFGALLLVLSLIFRGDEKGSAELQMTLGFVGCGLMLVSIWNTGSLLL